MPIRIRLAALFAAGTALLVAVGGLIFVNELSGALTNSVATGLESRATLLLAANTARQSLTAALERTNAASGPAEFAQILSPSGSVIDSTDPESKQSLVAPSHLTNLPRGGNVFEERLPGGSADVLVYVEPLSRGGETLVVGASLATVDEAVDGIETSLLIGGPIAVTLAALASYLLAGAALRPVERMRRQAAAVSEHDEAAILDVPRSDDEIAALAKTLNELLARLHGALGRQRGFVTSAGHELRTPLANLKLELELALRRGRDGADLRASIESASSEVDHLARLTDSLLLLAQSDESNKLVLKKRQDVVPVLEAVIKTYSARATELGVALELSCPSAIELSFDDLAMRRVLENVIDNALCYAGSGSSVQVVARAESEMPGAPPDASLVVDVLDEGPGFPPEFLPRAFERFSRPDEGRVRKSGGVGLGLAIVKALTEAHGGSVELANRVGRGALVRIRLPISDVPTQRNGTNR